MKKLSAIFMMLLLVGTSLCGFQVFATSGVPNFTIVAATATTTGTTIDAKTTSRNGCSPSFPTTDYSLGNDRYVEYLVNVEEAGRYRISSSLKPVKAANYMKVYVNECLAGSSSAFGVDSWTLGNYNLYEVDLLKGINEIRFVSTTVSGSAIYLFKFSFLKIGEATTITRRLANYDNKITNKTIDIYRPKDLTYPELNTYSGVTYGASSMAMSAGAWTEYNINIPSGGKYNLSMNVGSLNSDVTFSLNGIQAIIKNISTGGSSSAYRQLIDIGDLMLTKGESTLRVATTADISFTTMMFTKGSIAPTEAVTITKTANNYDSKSGTGVTDFEDYIRLDNQSGWVQYNVNLPIAGNYQISVEASTLNDSAFINVLLDNSDMGTYSIPNTQDFGNIILCTLSLNSDANSIQFSVPEDKAVALKSFKLERILEPVVKLYQGTVSVANEQSHIVSGDLIVRSYLDARFNNQSVTTIVALYKQGELYKVATNDTVTVGLNTVLNARINGVVINEGETCTLKLLHWNNLQNVSPLYPVYQWYTAGASN